MTASGKNRIAIVGIGVLALLAFWLWDRDATEWLNRVPARFRGRWTLVKDYYSEDSGIVSFELSAGEIVVHVAHLDGSVERDMYPVRRVSVRRTEGAKSGELVLFYGRADEETIAKRRLAIFYGRKEKLIVREVVRTGGGEDRFFELGEFVKISPKQSE